MKFAIIGLALLLMAGSLNAGNNPDFKVAVHVLPHDPDRSCQDRMPEISSVDDIQTTYPGCGEIDFFPVFYGLNEYQGIEYAVTWPGSSSCVFVACSYGHMGEIIWPGDWISHVWDECMPGPIAIPGWGRIVVEEPGRICVVNGGASNSITVGDCNAVLDHTTASYCAGVCGAQGDKPGGTTTGPTKWGAIKRMFR